MASRADKRKQVKKDMATRRAGKPTPANKSRGVQGGRASNTPTRATGTPKTGTSLTTVDQRSMKDVDINNRNAGVRNQNSGGLQTRGSSNVAKPGRNRGPRPRGPGMVINGDPALEAPRRPLKLEGPRPMKDITPSNVAKRAPTGGGGAGARAAARGALGAVSRIAGAGGIVGAVLAPSELGSGTRPEFNTTFPGTMGGPSRHTTVAPKSSAATRGRRNNAQITPSGPSSRPQVGSNYRPTSGTVQTKTTGTSGTNQASNSSAPSVSAAAGVPSSPSKTMAGVQAAMGPQKERNKRNFRPFGEGRVGSGK